MKLVEILARELEEWPEGVTHAVQDGRGERKAKVWMLKGDSKNTIFRKGEWFLGQGVWPIGASIRPGTLATDHATAIVTRADWEAERAKTKAPKANDGWVRHRGGKCPVDAGTLVDVRYRDGVIHYGTKALVSTDCVQENWVHESDKKSPKAHCDIMAYKIHKQADQPQINLESGAEIIYSPGEPLVSMEPADTMLAIRDRIRELETQRAEVESVYQLQISEITQERESLVQKLAGEGLALAEVVVQPVEDMSNPENWRKGDFVACVKDTDSNGITVGKIYELTYVTRDCIGFLDDDGDHRDRCDVEKFKWHSRPAS